jgi:hypothetical protein
MESIGIIVAFVGAILLGAALFVRIRDYYLNLWLVAGGVVLAVFGGAILLLAGGDGNRSQEKVAHARVVAVKKAASPTSQLQKFEMGMREFQMGSEAKAKARAKVVVAQRIKARYLANKAALHRAHLHAIAQGKARRKARARKRARKARLRRKRRASRRAAAQRSRAPVVVVVPPPAPMPAPPRPAPVRKHRRHVARTVPKAPVVHHSPPPVVVRPAPAAPRPVPPRNPAPAPKPKPTATPVSL